MIKRNFGILKVGSFQKYTSKEADRLCKVNKVLARLEGTTNG